jgi:O-antigen ligase
MSMLVSFKAMIVVVAIALVVFRLAKPIALKFCSERDYIRRRNIWLVLTITALLSPSFWLFVLIAAPLYLWAGKRDANPLALYLLLMQVIPDIPVEIPVVGINRLFELDNYRLLSFCVLVPTVWRLRKQKNPIEVQGLGAMNFLLLAYGALQVALFVPIEIPGQQALAQQTTTDDVRRGLLFLIDIYVLFVATSRTCVTRQAIAEALAMFCLACVEMAPVALFESLRHWLLYFDLSNRWGSIAFATAYYMRGDTTRAAVSAGHPLMLGYMMAIAFGFWLYLQSHVKSRRFRVAVAALLWLGLLAAYGRGPWLGAVVIYFIYAAVGPRGMSRLFKATAMFVLLGAVIFASPVGDRIVRVLPFVGKSGDDSLTYRQRLAERSWELIQIHPYLGDQSARSKMEDLRQGEGIIDFVNTYMQVTLYYGFVGLSLFLSIMLIALRKAYRTVKKCARSDPDLALLGASLVACIMGTLVMIAASSFIGVYVQLFYILAGLAVAYANLGLSEEPSTMTQPAFIRTAP